MNVTCKMLSALIASVSTLAIPTSSFSQLVSTQEEANEIASEVYIYAYPMVLSAKTNEVGSNVEEVNFPSSPVNQIAHARAFPDETFTIVVRPNADTLYSSLAFDVSKEPLLFQIPDSEGRYYLLAFMDLWSDVFASIGSRTTGNHSQSFAIVGPNWEGELPEGFREYRSPTGQGILIGRTQTNGAADYENVHRFQDGIIVAPLSRFGQSSVALKNAVDPTIDMTPPPTQVDNFPGDAFFQYFAALLEENPPHANDYPILDRMARIGIKPGVEFEFETLPDHIQKAMLDAPKASLQNIMSAWKGAGNLSNGWRTNLTAIGTYGTDYLHRAGVAYGALGANVPEDALYPTTFVDSDGDLLQSDNNYILHFKADEIPPVRAFWSLTMYNDKQGFAANEIRRFAIGDRNPLKFNDDGSLDLYIQRDRPADEKVENWLPAPQSGSFSMNMRLYWPKAAAATGRWSPPPVKKVLSSN